MQWNLQINKRGDSKKESGRASQKVMARISVVDVENGQRIVRVVLLRETDRLPLQLIQVRPEVQVVALKVLLQFFANSVLGWRDELPIRVPLIRAIPQHRAARKLGQQLLARLIRLAP
jgi:hypothetical protein